MIANTLDYSVSVFPVTLADQEIDVFEKEYTPLNDLDERVWKNCTLALPTITTAVKRLTQTSSA